MCIAPSSHPLEYHDSAIFAFWHDFLRAPSGACSITASHQLNRKLLQARWYYMRLCLQLAIDSYFTIERTEALRETCDPTTAPWLAHICHADPEEYGRAR